MDSKKIGAFILNLRKDHQLSQEDLAKMIPISREAVSKWERGVTIPSSETLLILSNIFNVSVDSLLLGEYPNENQKNQLQSLTLEILDDNNKKKKKLRSMRLLVIILSLSFISLFFGYYFFTTYDSVKVYMVNGNSKSFEMTDGIFITTKSKSYFRLGNLKYPDDINITGVEMYYIKNNKKTTVFISNDYISLIKDYTGYNAYFGLEGLQTVSNNTYLKINYNEKEEEVIHLKLIKDFRNNKIF